MGTTFKEHIYILTYREKNRIYGGPVRTEHFKTEQEAIKRVQYLQKHPDLNDMFKIVKQTSTIERIDIETNPQH